MENKISLMPVNGNLDPEKDPLEKMIKALGCWAAPSCFAGDLLGGLIIKTIDRVFDNECSTKTVSK